MNSSRVPTCITTLCHCPSEDVLSGRVALNPCGVNSNPPIALEFDEKRENAVSIEAQAVLDVIENPAVAQALQQDKNQKLQYLNDNYNVRRELTISVLICIRPTAHARENHSAVYLWPIPILLRELHRRRRLSIPFRFRVLSTDNDLNNSAHRGKLASDILTCRWEVEEFNTLRDSCYSRPTSLTDVARPGRSSSISTAQRRGSSS